MWHEYLKKIKTEHQKTEECKLIIPFTGGNYSAAHTEEKAIKMQEPYLVKG
jgi:hypothetical protein